MYWANVFEYSLLFLSQFDLQHCNTGITSLDAKDLQNKSRHLSFIEKESIKFIFSSTFYQRHLNVTYVFFLLLEESSPDPPLSSLPLFLLFSYFLKCFYSLFCNFRVSFLSYLSWGKIVNFDRICEVW